jgi:hypothetical protein
MEERDWKPFRNVLDKKEKKKDGRDLSTYLFCPGGAAPDGFWFSVSVI